MSRIESPFAFAVPDLLAEAGRRRKVAVDTPVSWALAMSEPAPGSSLVADVTLEGVNGGVYVRADVSLAYRSTCQRCLATFDHDEAMQVAELVGDGADYELSSDVVDLEPLLRDAVLGDLSDSPSCRPDCKGLCSVCGADLNTDSCAGHDDEPDSPFAALRDLLQP